MTGLATRRALDRYIRQQERRAPPNPNLDAARGVVLGVILSLPVWVLLIIIGLWAFG